MQNPTSEEVNQFVIENSQPFVTTRDVASEFDSVSRRTVRKRLNKLKERGEIQKREIGGNSVVWWAED